jgi:putative transcriptional regulator
MNEGQAMYHYLECGLPKIWLENGYQLHETPYGESLAIDDLAGLHRAIGRSLARKPKLTGAEL